MLAAAACGRRDEPRPAPAKPSADAAVCTLADAYLAGYFERNPDAVTIYGVPGRRHDTLPDNSLGALNAWHAREDAWLGQAKRIDPAAIETPALRATYAVVREALEGSAAAPCLPLRAVDRQPDGQRLAGAAGIPRHDSTRRCATRRPSSRGSSICWCTSRSSRRSRGIGMLGNLEITASRDEAQQATASRFHLTQFHDRVLEDDAVPVSFLHDKIRAWGRMQ